MLYKFPPSIHLQHDADEEEAEGGVDVDLVLPLRLPHDQGRDDHHHRALMKKVRIIFPSNLNQFQVSFDNPIRL